MIEKPVFRFAPSPNGYLHLGHAYSALLNQKLARQFGGRLLLRIEDIDTARCTQELEAQMLRDLEWIGFEWDGIPRRQSEHFDEYMDALEKLKESELVYPSLMSRGEIRQFVSDFETDQKKWPRDPDGAAVYPGQERNLEPEEMQEIMAGGKQYALRLNMEKACGQVNHKLFWNEGIGNNIIRLRAQPSRWGDVILARKDTPTSYHLCCVMDDALQGVTHVVRGQDLYEATSIHVLLQEIMTLEKPDYHHHRLIHDEDGLKLSKSAKHTSLMDLRASGITSRQIPSLIGLTDENPL